MIETVPSVVMTAIIEKARAESEKFYPFPPAQVDTEAGKRNG